MPRIETTTRTLFTFNELSDEAKQTAIDACRDFNVDHDWHEYTLDLWKKVLGSIGFHDFEIYFSGFYSQGDGAAIEPGRDGYCDLDELIAFMANEPAPLDTLGDESKKSMQAWLCHKLGRNGGTNRHYQWLDAYHVSDFYSVDFTRHSHRHNHENSHTLSIEGFSGRDTLDTVVDALGEELDELRRDICRTIFDDLRTEYEYLTGDEAIIETIIANDYEFDADGNQA